MRLAWPFNNYLYSYVFSGEEINKICENKILFAKGLNEDMTAT